MLRSNKRVTQLAPPPRFLLFLVLFCGGFTHPHRQRITRRGINRKEKETTRNIRTEEPKKIKPGGGAPQRAANHQQNDEEPEEKMRFFALFFFLSYSGDTATAPPFRPTPRYENLHQHSPPLPTSSHSFTPSSLNATPMPTLPSPPPHTRKSYPPTPPTHNPTTPPPPPSTEHKQT